MRSKSSWQLDANSNSRVHTGATREFSCRREPMGGFNSDSSHAPLPSLLTEQNVLYSRNIFQLGKLRNIFRFCFSCGIYSLFYVGGEGHGADECVFLTFQAFATFRSSRA